MLQRSKQGKDWKSEVTSTRVSIVGMGSGEQTSGYGKGVSMAYGCPLDILGSSRCVPLTPQWSTGIRRRETECVGGQLMALGGGPLSFKCLWNIQEVMLGKQPKYLIWTQRWGLGWESQIKLLYVGFSKIKSIPVPFSQPCVNTSGVFHCPLLLNIATLSPGWCLPCPGSQPTFLKWDLTLRPLTKMSPEVMGSFPVSNLKIEVFPAPLRPRRPKHSSAWTVKEILFTASGGTFLA